VTAQEGGSIRIEANWKRLRDPAKLQAAMDRAGAKIRIYFAGNAPAAALPRCAWDDLPFATGMPDGAVELPGTDGPSVPLPSEQHIRHRLQLDRTGRRPGFPQPPEPTPSR